MFGDPLTLVLLGGGFLMILASVLVPKLVKPPRQVGDDSVTRARTTELRSLERVEEGVLHLEETSRELFGRIDTRARMLILLIEEADASCRKLEQLAQGDKP